MNDSDDNEDDVRDVSKTSIDQEMEQMPTAAQVARQRNHCGNPKEIKLGPKVTDLDILSGNQAAVW